MLEFQLCTGMMSDLIECFKLSTQLDTPYSQILTLIR